MQQDRSRDVTMRIDPRKDAFEIPAKSMRVSTKGGTRTIFFFGGMLANKSQPKYNTKSRKATNNKLNCNANGTSGRAAELSRPPWDAIVWSRFSRGAAKVPFVEMKRKKIAEKNSTRSMH